MPVSVFFPVSDRIDRPVSGPRSSAAMTARSVKPSFEVILVPKSTAPMITADSPVRDAFAGVSDGVMNRDDVRLIRALGAQQEEEPEFTGRHSNELPGFSTPPLGLCCRQRRSLSVRRVRGRFQNRLAVEKRSAYRRVNDSRRIVCAAQDFPMTPPGFAALRKARDENRNVDQCAPTGGKPRGPRGKWSARRTVCGAK